MAPSAIADPTGNATDADYLRVRARASLRATYLATMASTLVFGHIMIIATIAVLWRHVESNPLVLWGGLVSAVMIATSIAVKLAGSKTFFPVAFTGELVGSACWASLPLVALPESADWQTMQGVLLVGLILATLGNSTSNLALHLASMLPICVIGGIVFTVNGEGSARWLASALTLSFLFTLASGSLLRQVQSDLLTSSLQNEDLAANLGREGDRLMVLNDRLATANSHLDEQSRRDALTGLYNRAGFLTLLNRAVALNPGRVVVCYLDLDGFKRVNDAFGHRFGDLILCAVSRRISRVLGPDEVLARQGGDELTIFGLIDNMPDGLEDLGYRLQSVFVDPFRIEGRQIEIGVSVGVVWLAEYTSSDDLMRFADTALYKAKDLGRGQCAVFDNEMRCELERRTQLQADLGKAFVRSEITAYLQPVVDINTGEITSGEALARWNHNDGLRQALDFIDTARDLGMLDRINDVVLQRVHEFQRSHQPGSGPLCPITVNVSPMHLEAMLNRVLVEPTQSPVIIEITEDGIFSDLDRARRLLSRARDAGVKVLLDDFGVGFSSLSIATELPIDGFKIDRRFVASMHENPSAVAAVEAIVQLAMSMDLLVIAEGVETVDQLRVLRELGVRFAQGYYFSEAVPMEQFTQWLTNDFRFDVSSPVKNSA